MGQVARTAGMATSATSAGPITGIVTATTAISAGAYRQSIGQEPTVLTIALPAVFSAELHLYRARMDAPLHAIGAELRKGDVVVSKIEPVHAQGLSAGQVKGFLKEVLSAFSEQADESLSKVRCAAGVLAGAVSDLCR